MISRTQTSDSAVDAEYHHNRAVRSRSAFSQAPSTRLAHPSRFVIALGILAALWCLGFAALNIGFEITGRFPTGPESIHADTLSVLNWYVVAIKLVGTVVALLAITNVTVFHRPGIVGTALWAGFSTLTIYVIGSLGQAVGIIAGITGDPASLDGASVAYVLNFFLAATAFGILAGSYSRRLGVTKSETAIGLCGGAIVLASILFGLPWLLHLLGLSPAA